MHIQQIRRHSPLLWRVVNRVALWALALAGGLIDDRQGVGVNSNQLTLNR